jgi:hypothetical protein
MTGFMDQLKTDEIIRMRDKEIEEPGSGIQQMGGTVSCNCIGGIAQHLPQPLT